MRESSRFINFCKLILISLLIGASSVTLASSNQYLTYQGRVVRPDGSLIDSGNLIFTISLYSPGAGHCLLYSETQTVSMSGSKGMFALQVGGGVRTDGGSHSFNQVFVNNSTLSGLSCSSGTSYTSASTDDRELEVSFNDAGTTVSLSAMKIKSVPFALQAHEIDGWGLNNIVKVSTLGSPTTFTTAEMANAKAITGAACASGEVLKWNGSTWACAADITTGTATDAGYTSSNKGIVAFDTDAATSGINVSSGLASVNTGTTANKIVKLDGSAKLPAVDGSALTNLDPTHLSAAVPITKGGTGQITAILGFNALSPITTKGDLITSDGTNNVRLPAGTNGYVLTADSSQASGIKWAPVTAGTVTSVSSANADIAVATGTSTPVLTLNSGTGANQIVKLDGSAKLPAVDGSALTNLNAGNISSGTLPISRGGTAATSFAANAVIVSNGTGSALQALNCTSGQVVTFDVSGYAVCGAAAGTTGFVNGGNSFGANATLGTNDNYSLSFETNNTTRMTVSSTGAVGIGTTTPASLLDVYRLQQGTNNQTAMTGYIEGNPSSNSAGALVGVEGGAEKTGSFDVYSLTGVEGWASHWAIGGAVTNLVGGDFTADAGSGRTVTNAIGTRIYADAWGRTTNAYGIKAQVEGLGSSPVSPTLTGVDLDVSTTSGGAAAVYGEHLAVGSYGGTAVANLYGSYIATDSDSSGGATNMYGSRIKMSQSSTGPVTNFYGLYIDAITHAVAPTLKYSIYQAGSNDTNFFAGKVGIATSAPGALLDIGKAGSTLGTMRLEGNTSGYVQIQPSAAAGSWTMTLPANAGTNGYVLSTNGSGVTSWVAQSAGGSGTVTSVSSANADISVATGTSTPVLTLNSGTGANQIVKLDGSAKLPAVDGSALTSLDPTHLSAAVPINKGGTGQITAILGFNALSPLTTKGDLIASDGTNNVRLPAGTDGYVLQADSTQSSGLKWAAASSGTVTAVASANSDISVATGTSTPILTLNSGTSANQIVKLDGSAKLPAVDGSALTNLNAGNISSGTLPIARGGTAATSFAANAVIVSNGTGSALQALNCTSGQVITFDVSGYAVCGAAGASGFVNGGNSFGANATLGTNDAYSMGLKTNNTTRMTILSTGEIGIGTTSPSGTLDVRGGTAAAGQHGSSVQIYAQNGASGGAYNGGNILLMPGSGAFPLGTAGKVGIGVTSPAATLHIRKADAPTFSSGTVLSLENQTGIYTMNMYIGDDQTDKYSVIQMDTGTYAGPDFTMGQKNGYFMIEGATDAFAIARTSGNVGIGTTSPSEKLHVAGNIVVEGTAPGTHSLGFRSDGTNTFIDNFQNGPLIFRTNNYNEKMRISGSGNVGIGTSSPNTLLDVAGTTATKASVEGISAYVNTSTAYTIPDTSVNIVRLTLTGNAAITLPAFSSPSAKVFTLTVFLKQDGTGSRTMSFAGNGSDTVKWDSGTAPTISSTAGKITILQFTKPSDETVWYGSMVWKEN